MIILPDMEQGSSEWLRARLGVLTASQVSNLLTPGRKLSASRSKLLARLTAETILGEPVDDFHGTYWTDRGLQLEGEAGAYFELQTGLKPRAVGFVLRDETGRCGCSPDWIVYDSDGNPEVGVEVKCPNATTHIGYLLEGEDQYRQQVQFSLWVTGLSGWYFMSYFPGLPPLLRLVAPDHEWQEAFNTHVPTFLDELSSAIHSIKTL